jgi:uncharacterized membrane protein YkvA (DUF1232 family)
MNKEAWRSGPLPSPEAQEDFYQKIRKQVRSWAKNQGAASHKYAELILVAPDVFHLLCKLLADSRVPAKEKAKLGLVVAYFISPLDLMPEAIFGPIGFADDVALAAMVLHALSESVDETILEEHWAGEEPVLALLRRVLEIVDSRMGSGLVRRIRGILHR